MKKKYLQLENVCKGQLITIDKLRKKHTVTNDDRKKKLMRRLEYAKMKYEVELDNVKSGAPSTAAMGRLETELDILKKKIEDIDEETQVSGRKRQRVEDDINQDGIMEFRLPRAE